MEVGADIDRKRSENFCTEFWEIQCLSKAGVRVKQVEHLPWTPNSRGDQKTQQ